MILKVQYQNEVDRQSIIDSNSEKILIEEQNISEGNFLIFSHTKRLEDQVEQLRNDNQNDNLILFDVLATIYEELLTQKGSM